MGVKLQAVSGGSVELVPTKTASKFTATMPANTGTVVTTGSTAVVAQAMLATNVAGNGPAFSAYPSANATISATTYTKVILNTEDFDTASAFDSTTNYRFQPLVAGYYQINFVATMPQIASSNTNSFVALYKNGSYYKAGGYQNTTGQQANCSWSGLVYLNGSTDYLEMYVYTTAASVTLVASYTNCSGFLARAA
jgi:hypothetical protein